MLKKILGPKRRRIIGDWGNLVSGIIIIIRRRRRIQLIYSFLHVALSAVWPDTE
jgi:hypothetical protein